MTQVQKTPYYRKDDNELLGFVVHDSTGWQAQTLFGYPIARTETQAATEALLRREGLGFLRGVWRYYDADDYDWFPCVIKEASELQVTVTRTNEMGYLDPDDYKMYTIKQPTEETLVKTA